MSGYFTASSHTIGHDHPERPQEEERRVTKASFPLWCHPSDLTRDNLLGWFVVDDSLLLRNQCRGVVSGPCQFHNQGWHLGYGSSCTLSRSNRSGHRSSRPLHEYILHEDGLCSLRDSSTAFQSGAIAKFSPGRRQAKGHPSLQNCRQNKLGFHGISVMPCNINENAILRVAVAGRLSLWTRDACSEV
jgi:hypothetical protein